ncbi:MAG: hypothetical protein ACFE9L_06770 [Candidatus Hodarchaeota archaeon]
MRDYFIFTSFSRDYNERLNVRLSIIFLIISLVIAGLFAGIRGMYLATYRIGSYTNYGTIALNPIKGIESGLLEIIFFILLLLIYLFVYLCSSNGKFEIVHDVALVAQLAWIKDILFMSYVLIAQFVNPWTDLWYYYHSFSNLYNTGLYWPFILLIIIFYIPRIMLRFENGFTDYNKQILLAVVLSIVIVLITSLLHSIFKILIDLPLGLI